VIVVHPRRVLPLGCTERESLRSAAQVPRARQGRITRPVRQGRRW